MAPNEVRASAPLRRESGRLLTRAFIVQDPDNACLLLPTGCVYGGSTYANAFQLVELFPLKRRVRSHLRVWHEGRWTADRIASDTAPDGIVTLPLRGGVVATPTNVPPPPVDPTGYFRAIVERTGHIDIRGLQVGTGKASRFPIDELYIPLTTTAGARMSPEGEHLPNHGLAGTPEMRSSSRIKLEKATADHRLLAIIGDPGAGKTTFLKRIALALALKSMAGGPAGDDDGDSWEHIAPSVPLLISVASLIEHIAAAHGQTDAPTTTDAPTWLAHFMGNECKGAALEVDQAFFLENLTAGEATVLLDGLDEAPTVAQRQDIAAMIEKAVAAYSACRLVVTCRPAAYTGLAVLPDFTRVEIDTLEDDAIETFLGLWCHALFPYDPGRAQKQLEELLAALASRPDIRRLARNPVMLTALAVVHWNEKRLPEQRADLYESIISWLARARESSPGRPSPDHCVALLQNVALAMQDHSDGRQVEVSKYHAAEAIAPNWRQEPEDQQVANAQEFLQCEELDSGIIVARGNNVRFWHLTLQEYLAARALSARDDERLAFLRNHKLHLPEWREVVLLLAGVLYHQGIERVDAMFSTVLDQLGERDQIRQLKQQLAEAQRAPGQTQVENVLNAEFLKIACEELDCDVEAFKKKVDTTRSTESKNSQS